jgi:hypothetical protein
MMCGWKPEFEKVYHGGTEKMRREFTHPHEGEKHGGEMISPAGSRIQTVCGKPGVA